MFVNGYFKDADIDHINTIRTDNRAENLRWVTKKENNNNKITKKHYSESRSNFKRENHPYAKKVIQYDKKGNIIKIWDYMKQASEQLGINHASICECCQGKRKSAGGFVWKYLTE